MLSHSDRERGLKGGVEWGGSGEDGKLREGVQGCHSL